MTSACNIIYNGSNQTTDDLNVNYPLYCSSLTSSGGISVAGLINTNTGYAENNVKILDVKQNNPPTDINISLGHTNISTNATGFGNIAIGNLAGSGLTSGTSNISIGKNAGSDLSTGSNNISIGNDSHINSTAISNSLAIGNGALSVSLADGNLAIGTDCMGLTTTGNNNTIVGQYAMFDSPNNSTGSYNTGMGVGVLAKSTTGSGNVAVGYRAGTSTTTGSENTIIGDSAANLLTTGSNNVIIGGTAGSLGNAITTGSNNILIGHEAELKAATDSHSIVITTTPSTKGRGPNTTVLDPAALSASSTVTTVLGYDTSDGQVFASNGVTLPLGLTVPSATGVIYTTFPATPTGNASVTNNNRMGYAQYINLTSIGIGASITLILQNSLFDGAGFVNAQVYAQNVAAGACLVLKSVEPSIPGSLSLSFCNVGNVATGANGSLTIFYMIFNS